MSGFLEIDPLDDRQTLELAAQAVERELDRAKAQPFAATKDA